VFGKTIIDKAIDIFIIVFIFILIDFSVFDYLYFET